MIVALSSQDIDVWEEDIRILGSRFASEALPDRPFSFESFSRGYKSILDSDRGILLAAKVDNRLVGIIGAVFIEDFITGMLVVMEQFWYVLPENRSSRDGLKLFKFFEGWAISLNPDRIIMASLDAGSQLDSFLEKKGYQSFERMHIKWL